MIMDFQRASVCMAAVPLLVVGQEVTVSSLPSNCLLATRAETNPSKIGEVDRKTCAGDVSHYAINVSVRRVSERLGLQTTSIKFSGCVRYRFEARPGNSSEFSATIFYPIRESKEISPTDLASISHELGHVVQLKQAGSTASLIKHLGSRDAEVGADFLAGVALAPLGITVTNLASNMDLAGQYVESFDDHGTPDLRTAAFRRGYYLLEPDRSSSAAQLHLKFQTVFLQELQNGMPRSPL
jgi:hypothetical protein